MDSVKTKIVLSILLVAFLPLATATANQRPKNLSFIHYTPGKADTDVTLPGRCSGTVGKEAKLEEVGLTSEMLKVGVQCVAGDFDGNGYLDFALYGSKVSKLKYLERDYRIIFFDHAQVIFISQIRNMGDYGGEPDVLMLYRKDYDLSDRCPKSKREGLISWGHGEFNIIYLFDTKKKVFTKFSCPSGE